MIATPAHNGSDTSRAAAAFISPHAPTQRERVLEYIRNRGRGGATIAEIADGLGMRTASVCPRVLELRGVCYGEHGKAVSLPVLVADSGMRRGGPGRLCGKVFVAVDA